jgi:ribose-phosphate pyrophosphokinase
MKIIAGSSNKNLAQKIAKQLGTTCCRVNIGNFSNGEKRVKILDNVQGSQVALIQSFSHPTDEHIIEFLLLSDALERLGAKKVIAVIPWYGYSLQDKVFENGEALSAKVIANLVSTAYIHRTFLLDVHNTSIAGFFSVPTHHLSAINLFDSYIKKNYDLKNTIVASPDFGGLKRAWSLASTLEVDWVNIDKRRNLKTGSIERMELHGDVKGKTALVFDDVIVSGRTVIKAAEILKKAGAKKVHFLATHGLFAGESKLKLEQSQIDKIVVTNSVNHHSENTQNKIETIDCSNIFVKQLKKI